MSSEASTGSSKAKRWRKAWTAAPERCGASPDTGEENTGSSSSIFTFTMFAVAFVARLADAFVRLHGVLADGVNAAVVKPLGTLVHI